MSARIPLASIRFVIGWAAVFLFRLIPWRPPNVEPMLATVMPFSKRYGVFGSFMFGFLGIVLYDVVTSGWGSWTWVTAFCYGALGIAAHYYFRNREATVRSFLTFGVPGTILYDAVTMLIGPVFHHQSLILAVMGQIPFTTLHLLGTVVFSTILSPALYRWVVANESLEVRFAASAQRAQ